MSAMKRFSLTILLLLLLLSVMDDLAKRPSPVNVEPSETENGFSFGIEHIKVRPGDTVLTITEEINDMESLDIEQIIEDFETLNPGTDVDSLIPNTFYYFPLYNER